MRNDQLNFLMFNLAAIAAILFLFTVAMMPR